MEAEHSRLCGSRSLGWSSDDRRHSRPGLAARLRSNPEFALWRDRSARVLEVIVRELHNIHAVGVHRKQIEPFALIA